MQKSLKFKLDFLVNSSEDIKVVFWFVNSTGSHEEKINFKLFTFQLFLPKQNPDSGHKYGPNLS